MVACAAPVSASMRTTLLSPQLGIHRLPEPTANPEQGLCTVIVVPGRLVLGSSRTTLSVFSLVTQTACAVAASQSGSPLTIIVAVFGRFAMAC